MTVSRVNRRKNVSKSSPVQACRPLQAKFYKIFKHFQNQRGTNSAKMHVKNSGWSMSNFQDLFKTAITLAPQTVGRQSADLSADKMPDFSFFFIGRQKINYNYLVIIFFPSADSFWGFCNRPMIGR